MTTETIGYWLIALNVMAGLWLVYGMAVTELRRWRERRDADRISPYDAKQLRNVVAILRGADGDEARHKLHEFLVNWAATHDGKKTSRPQG